MGAGENGRTGLGVLRPVADTKEELETVTVLSRAVVVETVRVIILRYEYVATRIVKLVRDI